VTVFVSPLVREPGRGWRLEKADSGAVLADWVEGAFDASTRRRGLLGREGVAASALVIAPCSLVHTFFMHAPIDTVFVDREGIVVRVRHGIRPNRLSGAWGAFAAIELPAGQARRAGVHAGDRLVLTPAA
jgi:uncharacterized membrane protein (UPF0127 family)